MKVLAIIPARGGSKGIPGKNLKMLGSKPLLYWSIDAAFKAMGIDKIVVSTDDAKIKDAALARSADVIDRPAHLAGDRSLVIDAIRYTVVELENQNHFYDIILLLECTSPFKDINHIEQAIDLIKTDKADSVTTFKESCVSPGRLWAVSEHSAKPFIQASEPFMPRQKQPKAYQLTGEVYAFRTDFLKKETDAISLLLGRVVPIISDTILDIDIDHEIDFELAEILINKYHLT